MALQSVSTTLLKPTEKLVIKLSVSLLSKDGHSNGYYNIYEKGNTGYMTVDISSVVRFEYKGDDAWTRDQWVYITSRNIYQLIKGLDEVKDIFDNEKLFMINSHNELKVLQDEATKFSVVIDNLGNGQCLKFVPSVVYDSKGKDLMGMYMFINNSTRAVDLSIDEFEAIWYLFKNFNFRLETQSLLQIQLMEQLKTGVGNSTTAMSDSINETKQQLKSHLSSVGATSIFDLVNKKDPVVEDGKVEGGRLPKETPQSLDDL